MTDNASNDARTVLGTTDRDASTGTTSSNGPARYDAFLCYSHAVDSWRAGLLEEGLTDLARHCGIVRPRLKIFRDTTSLPRADGAALSRRPVLCRDIVEAVDRSDWLILLASPGSAGSSWVELEIRWWLRHKASDRLLLVATAGTWRWDPAVKRFDMTRSSAIHGCLESSFATAPTIVDMRWAVEPVNIVEDKHRLVSNLAQIAAPIYDVPSDQLLPGSTRLVDQLLASSQRLR